MKLFQSLNANARSADEVIAYHNGEPRTWAHWLGNVAALRQALKDKPAGYWAIYFSDAYSCSIALFALWSTDRTPLLLPDASTHTLERLPVVNGLLGEVPTNLHGYFPWKPAEDAVPPDSSTQWSLDCQTALFTSGSTGDSLTVDKTASQLVSEVETYVELWGEELASCTFFATVSHQHIYGLIFRLLLPLAIHRPFWAELISNPRNLLHVSQPFGAAAWVASPAQLKRTNPAIINDLPTAHMRYIFSSGGLLEPQAADDVAASFNTPAWEVYGSTETGGIAWRQQHPDHEMHPWTRLPIVQIRTNDDGLLEVNSPYTQDAWMTTGDRANLLAEDQFQMLGRADRIVKFEEKRISLTAIERELMSLADIDQAHLVVLEGARQQLAAVVVLSAAATKEMVTLGRNALIKKIRSQLLTRNDHHMVPRRFRFVHEVPTTTQGKIRAVDLRALFEHGERNVLPVVRSVDIDTNNTANLQEISIKLLVPNDLDYFAGHFAEFPVVPGVVQLLWVRHFAKLHLGFAGDVQNMAQVKFKAMMQPGDQVELKLTNNLEKGRLAYVFANSDQVFSSGTMIEAPNSAHG